MKALLLASALAVAATTAAAAGVRSPATKGTTKEAAAAAAALRAAIVAPRSAEAQAPLAALLRGPLTDRVARFKADRAAGRLGNVSVVTKYGVVDGVAGPTVNQFLGIPYAQQPVGPLRWKEPQEVQPWGTLNATWWGPGCIQSEWYWNMFTGSDEGCLYLNIYAPAAPPPAGGYPVMFFVHGGSWEFGSGSFLLYDAETDVALVKDVIIVTINYRLSIFGYLAGDLLKAESPDGSVGNYGFQDQRQALKFIIAVIADFGGNPNMITFFGESAGGASTSGHLVSPRSQGLFQRAIIESGAWSPWTAQPYNISATRLPQVAANTGCAGAPDVLACLRALNSSTIFAADHGLTQAFLEWSPVIDGVELPDDPRVLVKAGKAAPVPIMLGFNHDEGTLFNKAKTDVNVTGYEEAVAAIIGPKLAPLVVAQYPPSSYQSPWWALTQILTDSQMLCPGKQGAAALTGPARNGTHPVYVYYYTHVFWFVEYIVDLFRPLGCFHGSELLNVFDLSLIMWGPGEPELGKAFVSYWTNFAISGNPNAPGLPTWNQYTSATVDAVGQIDTGAGGPNVTMVHGLRSSMCKFWGNLTIPPADIWG